MRLAVVDKKYRKDTKQEEWALFSKDRSRVLEWFGPKKPDDETVAEAERRVQFFKHQAAGRVALRWLTGAALTDVSKLRFQAVFLMGAGGSGKGFVGRKWLKYLPGAPSTGFEGNPDKLDKTVSEMSRSLTNLDFDKAKDTVKRWGFDIDTRGATASTPFVLYTYGDRGKIPIPENRWKSELPKEVYDAVVGMKEFVFRKPVYEIPSYWRQVDPDLYKKEIVGYLEKQPGFVHEMSSEAAKTYFSAILPTGDPMLVDGTGKSSKNMLRLINMAEKAGYNVSIVYVLVPLTVNHIRNYTRPRQVDPKQITAQWFAIQNSFAQLRSDVERSKVVINRNDSADIALYKQYGDEINEFIASNTRYANLYELIKDNNPGELSEWGTLLQTGLVGDESRRERFERLEEKRRERGGRPRQFMARRDTPRSRGL